MLKKPSIQEFFQCSLESNTKSASLWLENGMKGLCNGLDVLEKKMQRILYLKLLSIDLLLNYW